MTDTLVGKNISTLRYAANFFILVLFLLVTDAANAASPADYQELEGTEETVREEPDAYKMYLAQAAVRHFRRGHRDLRNYRVRFRWKKEILLVSFSRKITFDGEFFISREPAPKIGCSIALTRKGKLWRHFARDEYRAPDLLQLAVRTAAKTPASAGRPPRARSSASNASYPSIVNSEWGPYEEQLEPKYHHNRICDKSLYIGYILSIA